MFRRSINPALNPQINPNLNPQLRNEVAPPKPTSLLSSQPIDGPQTHRQVAKTVAQKVWLFTYNMLSTLGWGYIFLWIISHWALEGTSSLKFAFEDTKALISMLQLLSLADLVHEYVGWIRHNDLSVFESASSRVFARNHLFFLSLWFIAPIQRHQATGLMLFLWAFMDLLRFPFYALNSLGMTTQFLTWFRYSAFVVSYPISFIAETVVWFLMMPYIAEFELHSIGAFSKIFPSLRFGYFYAVILYQAYRLITFPVDYRRILRERRRRIFGEPIELRPQEKSMNVQTQFHQQAPISNVTSSRSIPRENTDSKPNTQEKLSIPRENTDSKPNTQEKLSVPRSPTTQENISASKSSIPPEKTSFPRANNLQENLLVPKVILSEPTETKSHPLLQPKDIPTSQQDSNLLTSGARD